MTNPPARLPSAPLSSVRVWLFTSLALLAFAANSLLARMALRETAIDPAGFTVIRLLAGAAVLALLIRARGQPVLKSGDAGSALALFAYSALFSFAYVSLDTGTGALLLFGAVQATMILAGWLRGDRFSALQWGGFALAVAGLLVLLLPGTRAPSPAGAMLMLGAGIAWGAYSLRGRGQANPTAATAGNFVRAVPMALALGAVALPWLAWDARGALYAVVSGAVTSGLGYAAWYAALRGLSATRAATVQLSVPLIAALLGLVFLAEPIGPRFAVAAIAVIVGIAAVIGLWHPRSSGKR